jgi:ribosomal-protein-alanine N-acetyltransferase
MPQLVRLHLLSTADEAEFIAAGARSRKLHRPWVSPPLTPDSFAELLARVHGPDSRGLVIRRTDTEALAGFIHVSNIVRGLFQSAYLGYYAFAGHEGQGLMRAGLTLTVRTAFKDLKLHRLEANIQPQNKASIALVRSCGFSREGYSPRYLKIGGRWRDHERWAILST